MVRVRQREHDPVLPRRPVALVRVRAEPAAVLLLFQVVERRVDLRLQPVLVSRLERERVDEELRDLARHVIDGRRLVRDRRRLQLVEREVRPRVRHDGVLEAAPVEAGDLLGVVEHDVGVGQLHDLGGSGVEGGRELGELIESCGRSQHERSPPTQKLSSQEALTGEKVGG